MNDVLYQVMPPLTADEYAELKSDIKQRGVMVPVEYDEDGNILDGHHRIQICEELGITDFPKVIRVGMTEAEKRTHARKLNMARRQLNQEQRRELIREQLMETPELSDRQIAKAIGVSDKTVGTQRRDMESTAEIPQLETSIGADGKERPRHVERTAYQENEPYDEIQYTDDDAKEALYHLDELMEEHPILSELVQPRLSLDDLLASHDGNTTFYEHAKSAIEEPEHKPHVAFNSGNNEWYTPADIIEAARTAMGNIDFDPASSDIAQEVVKASEYYTAETDGLTKDWRGNVWMNPPYATELIGKFVDKLIEQLPHIEQAIVLVNNATETEWFGKLASKADMVCFPRSRVKFYMPDGRTGAPLQGQAILYFGRYRDGFYMAFKDKGWLADIR